MERNQRETTELAANLAIQWLGRHHKTNKQNNKQTNKITNNGEFGFSCWGTLTFYFFTACTVDPQFLLHSHSYSDQEDTAIAPWWNFMLNNSPLELLLLNSPMLLPLMPGIIILQYQLSLCRWSCKHKGSEEQNPGDVEHCTCKSRLHTGIGHLQPLPPTVLGVFAACKYGGRRPGSIFFLVPLPARKHDTVDF